MKIFSNKKINNIIKDNFHNKTFNNILYFDIFKYISCINILYF